MPASKAKQAKKKKDRAGWRTEVFLGDGRNRENRNQGQGAIRGMIIPGDPHRSTDVRIECCKVADGVGEEHRL